MSSFIANLVTWDAWLPKALAVVIRLVLVLLIAWGLNRISRPLIHRLDDMLGRHRDRNGEQERRVQTWIGIVEKVVSAAIWIVAGITGLQVLGVNTAALLTAAGVGGLAIGFGAQNLVRDFLSGFFILAEDQIRVGDVVTINGTTGTVQAINPRTTVLRDLSGTVHIFPNGLIETVSNLTKEWARSVIEVSVPYTEDVDRVMALLQEIGRELEADREYGPRIVQPVSILGLDSFGPLGVTVKLTITTQPGQQWAVGREFRRRVKNRFDAEGIRLSYPHTTLQWQGAPQPLQLQLEPGGTQALVDTLADRVVEEVFRRLESRGAFQPARGSLEPVEQGQAAPSREDGV